MKTFFKQSMLVSAIAFTTIAAHANIFTKTEGNYFSSALSGNFLQNNCFYYADPFHQQEARQAYTGFPYLAAPAAIEDTLSSTSHYPAKIAAAKALVNFVATATNYNFNLSWNTLAENANDHFEIERSVDGVHFEKVGEAKGTDISSGKVFSFLDKAQASLLRKNDFYYRLKEVDADSSIAYSKVMVSRMFYSKNVFAISVTPDAALNDILVNVQLKKSSYVVMKVSDSQGNEVMRKNENADFGTNNFTLTHSSNLKPGVYTLEIIVNSDERMTMKLIKD